jgi:hypothetical protein
MVVLSTVWFGFSSISGDIHGSGGRVLSTQCASQNYKWQVL